MLTQSQMPTFKKGDLVTSVVALPVARTELTKEELVFQDRSDPHRFHVQAIPINSSPVRGLLIKPGVVFEVDAVLPWDDFEDEATKQYRLVLATHYLPGLAEAECQLVESEFTSLNTILGESNDKLSFYAYAKDEEIVLRSAIDGRVPGEAVASVWPADENFPWTVRLQFPSADDVLRFDIQAWFYSDENDGEYPEGSVDCFGIWMRPRYARQPQSKVILSLLARPGKWLDLEQPIIAFHSCREAQCIVNLEEQTIDIVFRFSIWVDLQQQNWGFIEDSPAWKEV